MSTSRLETVTRALRIGTNRRTLVGALTLGSTAIAAPASAQPTLATRLAQPDPDEQAVALYEALAAITESHIGTCQELASILDQFKAEHADTIAAINTEQDAWSQDKRNTHADTYGDRMRAASKTIIESGQRCSYIRDSTGTPVATPAGARSSCADRAPRTNTLGFSAFASQDYYCDCEKHCPVGVGHCIESGASCAAGDKCDCCMVSLCGHASHCRDNCYANGCCDTPCTSYSPPA